MKKAREYNQDLPNYGKLFTVKEWKDCVKGGGFIRYDGWGYYVKDNKMSNANCWNEKPKGATHIMWFNR